MQRIKFYFRNRYFFLKKNQNNKIIVKKNIVEIETSKETAKFSVSGDIGNGSITIKHNEGEKEGEKVCLNVD
jgi:hypothetical protein